MPDFETDWLFRSVLADFGWLGPDNIISHTGAFAFTDANKEPLNGNPVEGQQLTNAHRPGDHELPAEP